LVFFPVWRMFCVQKREIATWQGRRKKELLFLKKKKQKDFGVGGVGTGSAVNRRRAAAIKL